LFGSELFRKIRQIEIHTRKLVNDSYAGEYHSVFKGRGMEFDEVRPYVAGDEIRSIDWNVTARTGEPYVKRFVEERELTVMLMVDASGSGDFGSVQRFKRELAAELTAVLAFAATNNQDKVGLMIFTDQIELLIPPRKGRKHVLRIIRELLAFEPKGRGTDIHLALDTINRVLKRRSILFLVSDYLCDPKNYARILAVTNRRHDVIAIDLHDPLESKIPAVGLLYLEDVESGETLLLDSSQKEWRKCFLENSAEIWSARQETFRNAQVDRISVTTAEDYTDALTKFFQKRARKLRR
jgi:uncharacterized protein (DUF58 family)